MSLNGFNGRQGRPPARPSADQAQGAPAQQSQWPQQANWPAQSNWPAHANSQGQNNHEQPHWPQPENSQGGYAQPGYAPAQQGYGQPGAAASPYGNSQGYGADSYAPNFQPYNPAAALRGSHSPHGSEPSFQEPAFQEPSFQTPSFQSPSHHGGQRQPASAYGSQAAPQWTPPQDTGNSLPPHAAQLQAAYRASEMRQPEAEPHFSDWQAGNYPAQQPQAYDYGDAQGHLHGGQDLGAQDLAHDSFGDMGFAPAQGGFAQAQGGFADVQDGFAQVQDGYGQAHGGFAQAEGGELEQAYAEEEDEDYEYEEESRGRRPLMIVAALAGAVFVGGSMAYGYKAFFGGGPSGTPPVVKSAELPTKTKPADAGGKQFAHADSKIMGRLGEGSGTSTSSANDLDANGTRKVSTLVVGRDGSIQAPPAAPADTSAASETVSVPGLMVVDALGSNSRQEAPPAVRDSVDSAPQKVVVTPPPEPEAKPVEVAKAQVLNSPRTTAPATGSIEEAAPAAPKKIAAVAPERTSAPVEAAAPPVTSGNGYVAVLASVPKSDSSRIDALKRFADLQQKYSGVLAGKTPDVAEADLGSKGAYHRLVVGPPGSRQQASAVCVQLKANGYADCWVTSY